VNGDERAQPATSWLPPLCSEAGSSAPAAGACCAPSGRAGGSPEGGCWAEEVRRGSYNILNPKHLSLMSVEFPGLHAGRAARVPAHPQGAIGNPLRASSLVELERSLGATGSHPRTPAPSAATKWQEYSPLSCLVDRLMCKGGRVRGQALSRGGELVPPCLCASVVFPMRECPQSAWQREGRQAFIPARPKPVRPRPRAGVAQSPRHTSAFGLTVPSHCCTPPFHGCKQVDRKATKAQSKARPARALSRRSHQRRVISASAVCPSRTMAVVVFLGPEGSMAVMR